VFDPPVGDEADKQAVTVDDFLQSDVDAITAASDRYEQSTTLIGNLSRNGSRAWRGVWIKITNGQRSEVSFDSPNLDDALQKGMSNELFRRLRIRHAIFRVSAQCGDSLP